MAALDFEALPHRLATGLARVAVAMHLAADDPAAALERTLAQQQLLLLLNQRRDGYTLADLAVGPRTVVDAGDGWLSGEGGVGAVVVVGV